MGVRAGSSNPLPRPVVPMITPLMQGRVDNRLISATTWSAGADRGNEAKAYNFSAEPSVFWDRQAELRSLLMARAMSLAAEGSRKSSHGLARLMTEQVMLWARMKDSLREKEE